MSESHKYGHTDAEKIEFWKRIDALREISSNRRRECYSLGSALQGLEERTLKALEDVEQEASKMRRTWETEKR